MEVIYISSAVYDAGKLHHINNYLSNWDLSPVEGEALHLGSMGSKYGHIKIRMYASNGYSSQVIWNVPEIELPAESEAKSTVINVLKHFIGYLEGIKGHPIKLTFEINDGSYHAVDSAPFGYMRATIYAV